MGVDVGTLELAQHRAQRPDQHRVTPLTARREEPALPPRRLEHELAKVAAARIGDLVRATPTILGPWPPHEVRSLPRWSRGSVVLLGDSAHAMSPSAGQGASLALEDAMVLGMCSRDIGAAPRAFERFERLRRPRVEAIARLARRNSSSAQLTQSRLSLWLRDRLMPLFVRLGASQQDAGYAHVIRWDDPVGVGPSKASSAGWRSRFEPTGRPCVCASEREPRRRRGLARAGAA